MHVLKRAPLEQVGDNSNLGQHPYSRTNYLNWGRLSAEALGLGERGYGEAGRVVKDKRDTHRRGRTTVSHEMASEKIMHSKLSVANI